MAKKLYIVEGGLPNLTEAKDMSIFESGFNMLSADGRCVNVILTLKPKFDKILNFIFIPETPKHIFESGCSLLTSFATELNELRSHYTAFNNGYIAIFPEENEEAVTNTVAKYSSIFDNFLSNWNVR